MQRTQPLYPVNPCPHPPGCLSVTLLLLPQMSTLLAAVRAADVTAPLGDKTTAWTILAPTSDAFEDLLEALGISAEQLLGNKALLQKVGATRHAGGSALSARAVGGALAGCRTVAARSSLEVQQAPLTLALLPGTSATSSPVRVPHPRCHTLPVCRCFRTT